MGSVAADLQLITSHVNWWRSSCCKPLKTFDVAEDDSIKRIMFNHSKKRIMFTVVPWLRDIIIFMHEDKISKFYVQMLLLVFSSGS